MRTETGQTTAADGRDDLFALLTHRRRRRVLAVLRDAEEPSTLEEVAAELARRSRGDPGREHLERVRLSLHHWHLPKLAAAGVVDYDPGERTVSLSERPPGTALPGTDLEFE